MTTSPVTIIHYTTDGTVPSTASAQYTAPLSVTEPTSFRAIAFHGSMAASSPGNATYAFNYPAGGAPAFDPVPETFIGSVAVTMGAVAGSTIRYTTDGADPVATSTIYTVPVALSATTTMKAKAFKTGQAPSPTTSGVYAIQLALPTLTP